MWLEIIAKVMLTLVGSVVAFLALYMYNAHSEELSHISTKNASYCTLYSREMVLIETIDGKLTTADTDYILAAARKHYVDCISIIPALLPLPDGGKLNDWLADMRDLTLLLNSKRVASIGTVPAVEKSTTLTEDEWKEQCRAEYNTWEEETGTVIRRGNPERVRCPCGDEVKCGE